MIDLRQLRKAIKDSNYRLIIQSIQETKKYHRWLWNNIPTTKEWDYIFSILEYNNEKIPLFYWNYELKRVMIYKKGGETDGEN